MSEKENCKSKAPNKADVNTETAMNSRTVDAQEDPVRNRRPSWILRIAIKAHLTKNKSNTKLNLVNKFQICIRSQYPNRSQLKNNPRFRMNLINQKPNDIPYSLTSISAF